MLEAWQSACGSMPELQGIWQVFISLTSSQPAQRPSYLAAWAILDHCLRSLLARGLLDSHGFLKGAGVDSAWTRLRMTVPAVALDDCRAFPCPVAFVAAMHERRPKHLRKQLLRIVTGGLGDGTSRVIPLVVQCPTATLGTGSTAAPPGQDDTTELELEQKRTPAETSATATLLHSSAAAVSMKPAHMKAAAAGQLGAPRATVHAGTAQASDITAANAGSDKQRKRKLGSSARTSSSRKHGKSEPGMGATSSGSAGR